MNASVVSVARNGYVRRLLGIFVGGLALGLTACASPRLVMTVTRSQQWPAHTAGASYAIEPVVQQEQSQSVEPAAPGSLWGQVAQVQPLSELQYQTYARHIDAGMQAQGMVPAARPEQARMLARLSVDARRGTVLRREPVLRPALWLGLGYRSFAWHSGWGGHYGGSFVLSDRLVQRPVQGYRLHVQIADRGQTNRSTQAPTVFDATAEYVGPPVALATVMPYLIRAVFDDFPGQNGQSRQVVFNSKTGERLLDQRR